MNLLFNVIALAIGLLFPVINYLGFEWYYPRPQFDIQVYESFHFYGTLVVCVLALLIGTYLVTRKINFVGVGLIFGAVLSIVFNFVRYSYHLSRGIQFGVAIGIFVLLIVLGVYFASRRDL
ncbi:MAG TPA: hypothetical protein VHO47_02190 [Candidatus Babeliales bacterium]|nr:hypothetical protein [Candidatus Babeliales bacterium]